MEAGEKGWTEVDFTLAEEEQVRDQANLTLKNPWAPMGGTDMCLEMLLLSHPLSSLKDHREQERYLRTG